MKEKFKTLLSSLFEQGLVLFFTILCIRVFDLFVLGNVPFLNIIEVIKLFSIVIVDELKLIIIYLTSIGLILSYINFWSKKIYLLFFTLISITIIFIYLSTTQYFLTTNIILDHVILFFSFQELQQIAFSEKSTLLGKYFFFYLTPIVVFITTTIGREKIRTLLLNSKFYFSLAFILLALSITLFFKYKNSTTNLGSQVAMSKPKILFKSIYNHYAEAENYEDLGQKEFIELVRSFRDFMNWETLSFQYRYPLVHKFDNTNTDISSYFNEFEKAPNIVLVFCEGLSSSFSGPNARHGSMTPRLDSIYAKSLYWPNTISNTDRTHGVFANTLASLPHGFERGVLNLRSSFPNHLSLPKILISNGYDASFTYGGWAYFDNYEPFLRMNYVDKIQGKNFLEKKFNLKSESNKKDFTWGIHDKELFELYFKLKDEESKTPFLDIILNLSLHSPFDIPNQKEYLEKGKKRFMKVNGDQKLYEQKKLQLSVIAYQDEAIANFLKYYSKREEYDNTIFVFVGDHSVNALPNKWTIETHHVPLAIFSPKLKQSQAFNDIVAHTDIPVTLTSLLNPYMQSKAIPQLSHWLGHGLTTLNTTEAQRPIFIGRFNGDIVGVLENDTLLMDNKLYKINDHLRLREVKNDGKKAFLSQKIAEYKAINHFVLENNRLLLEEDAIFFPNERADFYFPEN